MLVVVDAADINTWSSCEGIGCRSLVDVALGRLNIEYRFSAWVRFGVLKVQIVEGVLARTNARAKEIAGVEKDGLPVSQKHLLQFYPNGYYEMEQLCEIAIRLRIIANYQIVDTVAAGLALR